MLFTIWPTLNIYISTILTTNSTPVKEMHIYFRETEPKLRRKGASVSWPANLSLYIKNVE